jgi:hypothetical protein
MELLGWALVQYDIQTKRGNLDKEINTHTRQAACKFESSDHKGISKTADKLS